MPEKQEQKQVVGAATTKERLCPECEGKMVQRTSKFGQFLGCSNYPKCRHIAKG